MKRAIAVLALVLCACGGAAVFAKPTAYGAELQECSARAQGLEDSLNCEDDVRARYGRPPLARSRDAGAKDGAR